jgi:hypothetical protein
MLESESIKNTIVSGVIWLLTSTSLYIADEVSLASDSTASCQSSQSSVKWKKVSYSLNRCQKAMKTSPAKFAFTPLYLFR